MYFIIPHLMRNIMRCASNSLKYPFVKLSSLMHQAALTTIESSVRVVLKSSKPRESYNLMGIATRNLASCSKLNLFQVSKCRAFVCMLENYEIQLALKWICQMSHVIQDEESETHVAFHKTFYPPTYSRLVV